MRKLSGAVSNRGVLSGLAFALNHRSGITFINKGRFTGAVLFGVLVNRVRPSRKACG